MQLARDPGSLSPLQESNGKIHTVTGYTRPGIELTEPGTDSCYFLERKRAENLRWDHLISPPSSAANLIICQCPAPKLPTESKT